MPDLTPAAWTCPLPLRDYPHVVMGHGGGGRLSADLVEHLFLPAFRNPALARLGDAAVLPPVPGRLAFTTDGFVVRPLFFPGGCVGDLAVHGTVNDLAVSGATPLYLSAGFILEEGLPLADLGRIVDRMAAAARAAGVAVVCGDTKVVDRGHGDGCYITTAGVGVVPDGVTLGVQQARPGDAVVLSGPVGNHGIAVLCVREGLEFETRVESDTAALTGLAAAVLAACPATRAMRDPTRGGLAATLNEIAAGSGVGIEIDEPAVPVDDEVRAACDLLGLDPLLVANEGKLVAVVPADAADHLLAAVRRHPLGTRAAVIGRVTDQHPRLVVARTAVGGRRVVSTPVGEQLPRIC
ncbi:hydrogenase expression/formation protein HypE [Urbifossiella limnaea]|uniref:Hydrogenase expression/formation protein HypE n=1 Tax=Urbifossiella limnaea TaxID=2528023 RepID=A0A517Y3E6_9BACT|nr:hydrogenase expression/formation protein HypE [Urbifossiella limnaea]QDU24232.1 Hydrogenase expression/formation protein HypE [Urbifossiella limnaea]